MQLRWNESIRASRFIGMSAFVSAGRAHSCEQIRWSELICECISLGAKKFVHADMFGANTFVCTGPFGTSTFAYLGALMHGRDVHAYIEVIFEEGVYTHRMPFANKVLAHKWNVACRWGVNAQANVQVGTHVRKMVVLFKARVNDAC